MLEIEFAENLAPACPTTFIGAAAKHSHSAKIKRLVAQPHYLPAIKRLCFAFVRQAAALKNDDFQGPIHKVQRHGNSRGATADNCYIRIDPNVDRKKARVLYHGVSLYPYVDKTILV